MVAAAVAAGLALGGLAASPFDPVGYLVRAGYWQARLLWGRVPLDDAAPGLDPARRAALDRIPRIKAFAEGELGLVARGTYDTINPGWDKIVWNVSACRPLSFTPKTHWFPIVGTVPYLGFFDEGTAREQARRLDARGFETYVRQAGAYSTLGWFDDPVLPPMLDWTEQRLADTLVHELVHANVWVPGSAQFNESLANFVGTEGGVGWIVHAYGAGSAEAAAARGRADDGDRYRRLLVQVVAELRDVYQDDDATTDQKLARKNAILGSLPDRADAAGFTDPARYRTMLAPAEWNNARLLQFRTYYQGKEAFQALYVASGGTIPAFLDRIRALRDQGGDPWEALRVATGVDVSSF
ncbi:MAG: aminopeptidase [Myxococcota bacterium]